MKITCPISKISERDPERIALTDKNQTLTYKQLNEHVKKYSLKFRALTIQTEQRAGLFCKNSIDCVVAMFALLRLGVPFVPLNLRWSNPALKDAVTQANCSFILAGVNVEFLPKTEIKIYSPGKLDSIKSIDGKSSYNFSTAKLSTDSEMAVFFTSGSSGNPKGAMLTVGNFYYSALGSNQYISVEKDDCWLASLPFYHVGGFAILFRCFLAGASVFVLPDFDQASLISAITLQKITHISLVPSMLENLINSGSVKDLQKMKCILLGGAHADEKLVQKIKRFSLPVTVSYGMTETASLITGSKSDQFSKFNSPPGKRLPFREISIINEKNDELPKNREGEIAVRGEVLFRGYLNGVKKYNSKTWFKTGDIGYLDKENNLIVKARKDDLIISGGENIYPAEIENVVRKHPGITACCVVGVPNSKWGQRPVLFVETQNPSTFHKEKLFQFLKNQLSKLMLPDQIYILAKLPQKSIGKTDKKRLLESVEKEK